MYIKIPRNLPKVYYTHWIPDEVLTYLQPYFNVHVNSSLNIPTPEEIIASAQDAFGLCISVRDKLSKYIISQCTNLKVISSIGRGYDNIDIETASKNGILVSCLDGIIEVDSVADHTWALILGLARKILQGDYEVRSGTFKGWSMSSQSGLNVTGKKLGIIGMGALGQAIASRAQGFRMDVIYYDPVQLNTKKEAALNIMYVAREQLLSYSDIICISSPLNPSTYHQISEKELMLMKSTSLLINTSRGSEVDETAVAHAIKAGIIAGYGADVYEMEERIFNENIIEIPVDLLQLRDKTLFSPHSATATLETRTHMAQFQAQAVLDTLQGKIPAGAINVQKNYIKRK